MSLKILAVGDIIGETGIKELKNKLYQIRQKEEIDFVIVNGENAAEGMGITEKNFNDIISQNVDVVTMGNHTWGKKDIFSFCSLWITSSSIEVNWENTRSLCPPFIAFFISSTQVSNFADPPV